MAQEQYRVATSVSITNETHTGSLKFKESKNWEGSNQSGGYPRTIWDNQTSQFTHQGGYWENSIGAVIYVGPNKVGRSDNCAWLVAWNVTRNGPSNHVYVDSGAVNKFKQVNWDVIKNKLRNSDSTKEYTDPSTGARVYADVENDERKDTYVLDVTFSVNKN